MGNTRRKAETRPARTERPATTPDAREQQLIAKAVDLAERQLEDGTASAQVVVHYLKLGSSRERLEQKKIEIEGKLRQAQIENIESAASRESLYEDALNAMRAYSGQMEIDYDH